MNHAANANTIFRNGFTIASRDIPKGTEITNDYREFDPVFCAASISPAPRVPIGSAYWRST